MDPHFLDTVDSAIAWGLENVRSPERSHPLGDGELDVKFRRLHTDEVAQYVDEYHKVMRDGQATIWRGLIIPQDTNPRKWIKWDGLGIYWSFRKSGASEYGGDTARRLPELDLPVIDRDADVCLVVVEAVVDARDIDWEHGFTSFWTYGTEQFECALKEGARVNVRSIDNRPVRGLTATANPRRKSADYAISLPGVDGVVDTQDPSTGRLLGHAADLRMDPFGRDSWRHSVLVGWHITSDPAKVEGMLRRGASVMKAYGARGAHAEYGPGLYISAAPQLWTSRATGKWDFIKRLTAEQLEAVSEALQAEVVHQRETGYISQGEYEVAIRRLTQEREYPQWWVDLAGQPYNISWWRDAWLESHGLRGLQQRPPSVVEVWLAGRYARMSHGYADRKVLNQLRRAGFQGAFHPGGMIGDPQLVVWDQDAILRFGDWRAQVARRNAGDESWRESARAASTGDIDAARRLVRELERVGYAKGQLTIDGRLVTRKPLTAAGLKAIADKDGNVTVVVPVSINDVISSRSIDLSEFFSLLATLVAEDFGALENIRYKVVDTDADGNILFEVIADASDIIAEFGEGTPLCVSCSSPLNPDTDRGDEDGAEGIWEAECRTCRLDGSCLECGSSTTCTPSYCNHHHCAECFEPLNPDHECGWNGGEHESNVWIHLHP
jgi:hypothetical protein